MTSTMKTARIENGALATLDIDVPEPVANEALIHISSAGVCHSDVHVARGHWYGGPGGSRPLGHEAIGIVCALGQGAEDYVEVGDRVILGLGGGGGANWCGSCEYCFSGNPRLCSRATGVIGTYAEYIATDARSLVCIADSIKDEEAPLACGGLTAYGAIKKLSVQGVLPGRAVAIIGAAGGLGHYAVQLAQSFGYRVVGVDVGAQRLDFVRSLGAECAVAPDEAREVVAHDYGAVDASVVFAARIDGFHLGFDLIKRGGLFVAVGLPPSSEGKFCIDPRDFFLKEPRLMYSAAGNVQDMRDLVAQVVAGKVKTHVSRTAPLSELNTVFDELEAGTYLGRAVITDLAH